VNLFGGSILSVKDLNVDWERESRLVFESVTLFGNDGRQNTDLTTLESTEAAVQDPVVGLEHVLANDNDHSVRGVAGLNDGLGIDIDLDAELSASPSFLGTPGVGHDVGRRLGGLRGTLGDIAAERGAGLRGAHSGEHSHWAVFGGGRGLIKVEHKVARTGFRVVVEPLREIHFRRC
jgi:hypothetical protein